MRITPILFLAAAFCMLPPALSCAATAQVTVQMTTPTNGSTVTSPVTVRASAVSSKKITGWRIYLDGISVYYVKNVSSINTSISMSAGSHRVTAKAWIANGSNGSAVAYITVAQPTTSTVAVSISPTTAVVQASKSQQFTAAVTGTTNNAVTWSVNGYTGGNSTVGTITTAGVYTAPATVPSGGLVTVKATSAADTTKSASASVSIAAASTPVTVSISPTSSTIQAGQSKQFSATVSGTTNTAVTWQVAGVTGGNSTVGLISSSGLYTAPLSVPSSNPVTVTARSSYDSTASANSTVTIAASTSSTGKDYYVSPSGSDSNDGSSAHPWATIQHASSLVTAGYTVHVLPGTYNVSSCAYPGGVCNSITTSASGTPSAHITFISDSKWGAKIVSGNNTYYAWAVTGSYVDIIGFDITSNGMVGIRLNGSNQRALNNYVHDLGTLACDSNGGGAIIENNYTSSGNDVIGNRVRNIGSGSCNKVQGIYQSNTGGHILNNIVSNVSGDGISTWHNANTMTISGNTSFNNGHTGILIGCGDGGCVSNNNDIVSNNISYNNLGYGIREEGITGTNNQYLNNLVIGNSSGNWLLQNGNTHSGDVTADPQFVNYKADGSGDYHLQSTSPAIDKGISTGAPNNDFDGGARPAGTTWDIGAYEYGSAPGVWPWQ